jgi:hypothetical protein
MAPEGTETQFVDPVDRLPRKRGREFLRGGNRLMLDVAGLARIFPIVCSCARPLADKGDARQPRCARSAPAAARVARKP